MTQKNVEDMISNRSNRATSDRKLKYQMEGGKRHRFNLLSACVIQVFDVKVVK
jgi:hypothetical protein